MNQPTTKTKTITINVTDDDIDRGLGSRAEDCAVSLAAIRALPLCVIKSTSSQLFIKRADDDENSAYLKILWPGDKVPVFIHWFDCWKGPYYRLLPRPEPFNFQIDIPKRFVGCEPPRPQSSAVRAPQAPSDSEARKEELEAAQ